MNVKREQQQRMAAVMAVLWSGSLSTSSLASRMAAKVW